MDCSICTHKITKVLHKIVKCPYCSHEACNSCTRKYLLTQPEARCMSCFKAWTENFLTSSFDQVFLTSQLEKHYISLFVEDQKKLFPETLEYIENFKYADKINTIRLAVETFQGVAEWVQDNKNHVSFREELVAENFPSLKGLVSKRLMCWKDCTDEVEKLIAKHINKFEEFTGQIKHQFIVQRCITANCIGFLRPDKGQNGKCDICKVIQCLHCLDKVEIMMEHSCDPQVLQTTKLMLLLYKQCPKCKVFIEKVVGCDQMFCTSCQCAFDWKTGQVILGFFHNPHHDEWVESGAQARALECQDIPTLPNDIVITLRTIFKKLNTTQPMFLRVYNLIKDQHAIIIEIPLQQQTPQNQYRDLRIQVLEGSMNEYEWKKYLYAYRQSQVHFNTKRQLFLALIVMIRELFEAIVEDLQEIVTKFSNPFMFTVKERSLPYPKDMLIPTLTKWELKLNELIFYFNKHSRETSNEDFYWKILLPALEFDLSPIYSFFYALKTNHELPFIIHYPVKFTAEFEKHPIFLPEESLLISKINACDSHTTLETSTALWLEINLTIALYEKLNNRQTFLQNLKNNFTVQYKKILQAQQEHTCKIMVHSVECTIYPWQAYLLDPTFPTECILKEHYDNIYCILLDGVKVKNALEVLLLPFTLKESPWTRGDIQIIHERCENFYHYFLSVRQNSLTSLSRVRLICSTSNDKFLQQMVWLWKTAKIKRKTKFMYEKWTYIFNKIEGARPASKSFSSSSTTSTTTSGFIKENEHVLLFIMLNLIIELNIISPSDSVYVYLKTNH